MSLFKKKPSTALGQVGATNVNEAKQLIHKSSSFEDNHSGLGFTVYNANGGQIVSIRRYNNQTDRLTQSLHIIPDDKNFSDELAKIVTLESLKGQ